METQMQTIWIVRDLEKGEMQYSLFSLRPLSLHRGNRKCFERRGKSVRMELTNQLAIAITGRALAVGEEMEVVCTEVVG